MATLLETLQSRLAGGQPTAPRAEGQLNIDEILAAKKGKAPGAVRGIGASTIGADITTDLAGAQLAQQQQAGQVQAAQLGAQAEAVQQKQQLAQEQMASQERQFVGSQAAQAGLQRTELVGNEGIAAQQRTAAEQRKMNDLTDNATLAFQKLASDRNLTRDNIFANARMENKELAARSDAADLEQKAFLMAIGDKNYMQSLNQIGAQRQLADATNFDKEVQRVTFGDNMTKMLDEMGFQAGQNATERQVRDQLAKLSNFQILDLAKASADQANKQAMFTAGGELVKAAATAGVDYLSKAPPTAPVPPTTASAGEFNKFNTGGTK